MYYYKNVYQGVKAKITKVLKGGILTILAARITVNAVAVLSSTETQLLQLSKRGFNTGWSELEDTLEDVIQRRMYFCDEYLRRKATLDEKLGTQNARVVDWMVENKSQSKSKEETDEVEEEILEAAGWKKECKRAKRDEDALKKRLDKKNGPSWRERWQRLAASLRKKQYSSLD
ncbi:hypothetical protein BDEG_26361 [Batrachochytrium dendrobatidis JEL423]|uniref:Uncharacterized protein n=1 Tax=Batrachochytrium dendrobatidis (strain JEL423) TaxID=403673 RepID=A0A177WTL9_BATDL|nr:hypothetical protein BDEG_26361 [Batrachochytrium dendrobatidis JEL423]